MSVKYIGMLVFFFVIFQVCLIPLGNAALNENAQHNLNVLSSFGVIQEGQTFGFFKYVKAPFLYFESLFEVMTSSQSSPMFGGSFEIIRWLVIAPMLAMVVFGLIIIFFGVFQRNV